MYEQQRRPRNIAPATMFLFRLGIIAFFAIISLRLYQLQVREGQSYNAQADENRFQIVETSAPRGVIYDKQTTILTRNRPSFEIALIPENIPEDDLDTTEVDEEAQEIENVLRLLKADTNTDVALRMGEILFRTTLSDDMFKGLAPWLEKLPGRLLHTNIIGCTIFAAVSGSSAATCATIGKMTLPELTPVSYTHLTLPTIYSV